MAVAPWHRRLFTQTLALQMGTIALALLVAGAIFAVRTQASLESQYGQRALAVAESVAAMPIVRDLVGDPSSPDVLQPIAESVRAATGVAFVVIADREGIRRTHPNPDRIGQRVSTDPSRALDGLSDVYVETGTLGQSVRGKVPIRDANGDVVGIVSVGILAGTVSEAFDRELSATLLATGGALLLGAIGAWVLARRIRRQTLYLQPEEIVSLYEHREATLQGIREGLVGIDMKGRVNLVNGEAARLLGLSESAIGKLFADIVPSPGLARLMEESPAEPNVTVTLADRVLVVSVMPVRVRSKQVGRVITLRDRTELEGLLGELESVHGLVDALRAQAHEFSNTLHTVSGLIEIGRTQEAVDYIAELSAGHQRLSGSADHDVGDELLTALVLAKSAVATERDIELTVDSSDMAEARLRRTRELVTIIGNVIDNAFDVVATSRPVDGRVDLRLSVDDGDLIILITDNGPGIPETMTDEIFEDGFTTKSTRLHAGMGLGLVKAAVRQLDGTIRVRNAEGAVFEIRVPGVVLPRQVLGRA